MKRAQPGTGCDGYLLFLRTSSTIAYTQLMINDRSADSKIFLK